MSLDESLVCTFGRMKFEFIIIKKFARFGINIYVVTNEETAYVIMSIVYIGKDTV